MRVDPQRRFLPPRVADGFTLIEVMVAMGLLAVGLITLAAMQIQALKQGSAGRHTADAAATARTYLEQAHRLPWTELSIAQAAGTWTTPGWVGVTGAETTDVTTPNGGATAVEQSYAVQWRVTDVAGNACLRDVEVRVTWAEPEGVVAKTVNLATRRFNWGDANC